jgi:hypothetical protein
MRRGVCSPPHAVGVFSSIYSDRVVLYRMWWMSAEINRKRSNVFSCNAESADPSSSVSLEHETIDANDGHGSNLNRLLRVLPTNTFVEGLRSHNILLERGVVLFSKRFPMSASCS